MQRRMIAPTFLVASLLIVTACGSDDPAPAASESATTELATDVGDGAGVGAVDTLAPVDGSSDTVAPADGSGDTGDTSAPVGNPALGKLAELSTEAVCAMFPEAEVEGIVGAPIEPGTGMSVPGLGTNCLFYASSGEFTTSAKLEFAALPWRSVEALAEFTPEGVTPSEACTIAGRKAICTPPTEGDFALDASVYVQLGGDDDIAFSTSSSLGLDVAKALAEYGLTKIPL